MIHIAVCGAQVESSERVTRLMKEFLSEIYEVYSIKAFLSGVDLIQYITTEDKFQIIIMDAVMKGLDGISTAKEIRRYDDECQIIFYADTDCFAANSYKVEALYYFVSPMEDKEFKNVIKRAVTRYREQDRAVIKLKAAGGLYYILYHQIRYIESTGHKVSMILADGSTLTTYGKLDLFERYLQQDKRFIRIHKSCLINAEYIICVAKNSVHFHNGEEMNISRNYMNSAEERFLNYMGDDILKKV